jgi:hypothetical protein
MARACVQGRGRFPEQDYKAAVEIVQKMDKDHDGKITYEGERASACATSWARGHGV